MRNPTGAWYAAPSSPASPVRAEISSRSSSRSWLRAITSVMLAMTVAAGTLPAVRAQEDWRRAPGDDHNDNYDYRDDRGSQDEGIDATVGRVSYVSGDTSFSRGDDPDNWQDLDLNVPMTTGDRVYTGDDGRLELQITGGNAVRLDARSDLTALNLTEQAKQLSLEVGTASFQIQGLADTESFEVDTPNAVVTFERSGEYRVDVDDDGNTQVGVLRGRATVAAAGGEVSLTPGDEMDVQGIDEATYEVVALSEGDEFDDWVGGRERRVESSRSYQYVSRDVPGCEDLDQYGRWVTMPSYGSVWTPTTVAVGWSPYSDGHWIWQDPWGWTWVGAEPWGWAPYHYGRWVFSTGRWYWVPVRTTVARVAYAPALVAFVGSGPGWSVSVGTGYVGWFPLAPRDPFYPWYGRRTAYVSRPEITYVNRVHVTVVNQTTFVGGGFVRTNVVRDTNVVREVSRGPIAGGPLPLVPTRGALRVSTRVVASGRTEPIAAARALPPRAVKPVVVRATPPPAPISFDRKASLIRENRGAPVTSAVEARVEGQDAGAGRARVPVRSVTASSGALKLNPRRSEGEVRPAVPVPQGRGRGRDRSADAAAETRVERPRPGRGPGRPSPQAPAAPQQSASPSPARPSAPPPAPPQQASPDVRSSGSAQPPAAQGAPRPAPPAAGPRPDTPKEKLKAERAQARSNRGNQNNKNDGNDKGKDKKDNGKGGR